MAWTITPDPDLYDVWHSSAARPGGLNVTQYKNPEIDKLLEAGRTTFDQAKRKAVYDRIQEIMAEDQPYTFLHPRARGASHRERPHKGHNKPAPSA